MRKFNVILRRIYGSTTSEVEVEVPDDVEEDPKVWIRNQFWQSEIEIPDDEGPDIVDEEFEIEEIESEDSEELHPHSMKYLMKLHPPYNYFTHPGYKDIHGSETWFDVDGTLKTGDTVKFTVIEPPEGQDFIYASGSMSVVRRDGVLYGARSGKVYTEVGNGDLVGVDGVVHYSVTNLIPEAPSVPVAEDLSNIPTDLNEYLAQLEEAEDV